MTCFSTDSFEEYGWTEGHWSRAFHSYNPTRTIAYYSIECGTNVTLLPICSGRGFFLRRPLERTITSPASKDQNSLVVGAHVVWIQNPDQPFELSLDSSLPVKGMYPNKLISTESLRIFLLKGQWIYQKQCLLAKHLKKANSTWVISL